MSTLKYEVYGAAGTLVALLLAMLSSSTNAVTVTTPSLKLAVIGAYEVSIWAESDSSGVITPSGSSVNLYTITYTTAGTCTGSVSVTFEIFPDDQWHFTTRFEMYADEQLSSLRVYISDESVAGAEIKAVVYELDTTISNADGGVILLNESDNYTITTQDLGAWIDILFDFPIDLYSGYAYEVGIAGFVHPTDSAFIGTSGQSMYNGEHSVFDEFGLNPNDVANQGVPTWYYLTRTPMVRMNFEPTGSSTVSDMQQTIFTAYPNPTNGIFTIKLGEVANYDVTVNNVLGQTVFSTSTNGMNTSIDLSSFDKGIYTVELKDENAIYTEKIIVE